MKKLNITKKQYDESKYFTQKYGSLKFVSESGKLYKTDKGVVIALEGTEPKVDSDTEPADESLADIGDAIKKTGGEWASKVKGGFKKAGKAIGDAIKGPFRKGDHIEMSGPDGDTVSGTIMDGSLGGKEYTVMLQRAVAEDGDDDEGKKDGDADAEVTRGELTDMLKDVVSEVEKVCDSQDISFEEVVGIEQPEGESDEEADKDEVVATKEDVADALSSVIDAVEKVADKNDIELPDEEDEKDDDDDDDDEKDDEDAKRDGTYEFDENDDGLDLPPLEGEGEEAGCANGKCECGGLKKECMKESIRKRRARLVREAIARRARLRKIRESRARQLKAKKVLESIRRRRAAKRVMEARKLRAKKVLESIRKRRAMKRVMESRRLRSRRARLAK